MPAFHQLTSSLSLLGYGAVTWVMGFGFVAMPIFFAIAWAIIFFVQIGPSAQLISLWYYLLFGGAVGASMFLGLPQPAIGWPEVFARLAGLLMASSVASFIELLHRQAAARRSPAVVSSVEAATRRSNRAPLAATILALLGAFAAVWFLVAVEISANV